LEEDYNFHPCGVPAASAVGPFPRLYVTEMLCAKGSVILTSNYHKPERLV